MFKSAHLKLTGMPIERHSNLFDCHWVSCQMSYQKYHYIFRYKSGLYLLQFQLLFCHLDILWVEKCSSSWKNCKRERSTFSSWTTTHLIKDLYGKPRAHKHYNYGYPQLIMDIHNKLWISIIMDIHNSIMDIHNQLWVSIIIGFIGFPWKAKSA